MRARARLVAEADGRGGTRLSTVYGEPPLLPRRTGRQHHPTAAEVHLVGGAAGPLGGDDLRVDIRVGPGAHLIVRTVAASLAQPSHPPAPSALTITAKVGAAATLDWLPEPTVATAGCDHLNRSIVDLEDGASLRWREELVAGRHAEPSGDMRLETTVRYAGRTILRHDLGIGPRAKGWQAMLDRAAGTVLLVGPEALATRAINRMPLANAPAALVSATGPDARTVRAALDEGAANTRAHDPDAKPGNWRKG
ncbi:urease accessory protein UreD [Asanoa sp. NPDC049518]|uniref:urease accessory protein UreD n=1 Tax=unclassified Asanoa TaxID=2685164 RepID=UPI0034323768